MIEDIKKALLSFLSTENAEPGHDDYCFFDLAEAHMIYAYILLADEYKEEFRKLQLEYVKLLDENSELMYDLSIARDRILSNVSGDEEVLIDD